MRREEIYDCDIHELYQVDCEYELGVFEEMNIVTSYDWDKYVDEDVYDMCRNGYSWQLIRSRLNDTPASDEYAFFNTESWCGVDTETDERDIRDRIIEEMDDYGYWEDDDDNSNDEATDEDECELQAGDRVIIQTPMYAGQTGVVRYVPQDQSKFVVELGNGNVIDVRRDEIIEDKIKVEEGVLL